MYWYLCTVLITVKDFISCSEWPICKWNNSYHNYFHYWVPSEWKHNLSYKERSIFRNSEYSIYIKISSLPTVLNFYSFWIFFQILSQSTEWRLFACMIYNHWWTDRRTSSKRPPAVCRGFKGNNYSVSSPRVTMCYSNFASSRKRTFCRI